MKHLKRSFGREPLAERRGRTSNLMLMVHRNILHLLLVSDILYVSRLYRVTGLGFMQSLLLGIFAITAIFYGGIAAARRKYLQVFLQIFFVGFIFRELFQFSSITAAPISLNATFQFMIPATFPVYSMMIADGLGRRLVRNVFYYAFAYTSVYLLISLLYQYNLVPRFQFSALILTDIERDDRLFNYAEATSLAWFVCLCSFIERRRVIAVFGLLVSGAAIYITLSRVYIALMILVTMMYLARLTPSTIRLLCLSILSLTTFGLLYGLTDDYWNPFSYFSVDSSGLFRADEYQTARRFVLENPLWGVGIAPGQQDTGNLTGNIYFAAGDLGALGVYYDWGIIGVILLFLGSYLLSIPQKGIAAGFRVPMFLTGSLIAAYACIAQTFLYASGATYLAIILGFWLNKLSSRDVAPRPIIQATYNQAV